MIDINTIINGNKQREQDYEAMIMKSENSSSGNTTKLLADLEAEVKAKLEHNKKQKEEEEKRQNEI